MELINSGAILIVPVLNVIGEMLKRYQLIKEKYVPLVLTVAGIALSLSTLGFSVENGIQGVLCAGLSVFGYEVFKDITRK